MTGLDSIGCHHPNPAGEPSAKTAVEWCGSQLTYPQLDAAVTSLADRLAAVGAARASVLVMGPLTPAYVVGLLATWRAGAVPVPVDAGLTPQQYAWLEERTCPAAVVSHDATPADQYRGATTGPTEIVLDAGTAEVIIESAPETTWRARTFRDPDAGYVIPTSGSTGEPKAIVGSRRGLEEFLTWFRHEFGLDHSDRCAAVTRVNFDPSLRELLGVLGVGGVLSLPPVDAQLDLPALADHLVDRGPTTLFLVPSTATRLADEPRLATAGLPDLRLIFFAGEVLGRRVVEQWAAIAPGAEIVNLYGQTEATLAQLYRRDVQHLDHDKTRSIPVGKPRPGVEVTITDPDSTGVGDILLAAEAPALGVLHPESGDDPGVHGITPIPAPLPTGDIGHRTGDGDLVIVGRSSNDIKFGGRRVSFHPLIDAVEALPEVRQCVVVDRGGPHVFVSVAPYDAAAVEPLRTTIHTIGRSGKLPRFTLHLRADLPVLRSGKVDRLALLESADRLTEASAAAAPDEPPGDAGQAEVEQLLRDLLGPDIGTAGLVDAGVSSLDMLTAVSKINRTYGIRLTVPECFALRDAPSLAREIDKRRCSEEGAGAFADETAGTPRTTETAVYPLSSRQLAYIWVCMPGGNANWCNLSREIQVAPRCSETAVAKALHTLLMRHDALGLALTADGRHQTWTPPPASSPPVAVVDTGVAVDSAAFRTRVQTERAALVSELIDPAAPPPIRALLVRGTDGSSVVLAAHHLFVDGLGMDVLADELHAVLTGRGLDPAADPDSYRAYCVATARAELPGAAAAYWRGLLDGVSQVRLPEATGGDGAQGELVSMPLGTLCTRGVHRIAQDMGVSAFTVALAAFETAVADTFGLDQPPIIVASQYRGNADAAAVGMFTTTLIVRSPGAPSPRHNVAAFARQLAEGAEHSGWEFDQRVADLGLTDTDCFPLSTILFNQRPMPRDRRARALGSWQPRALGRALRYQLQGEVQMSGPEMVMTYYYRKGISGADVIPSVHRNLLRAIRAGQEATDG
ncbi:AMP-binding protein [Streptomyces sp. ME19-01-6]|uniref:AMP-binding protein n=1 Tax=Streptomyces sp. ME19-01-6 TaxID=3028686 RepID=UPI0029B473E6|nr:AMP-binding protein [Streptomyces sp. ME19-01-6]MDX3228673.1 AMP-binding protein [Streptomyces sp. ME19-01-6]